jgi:diguanylate cyclase (GGDEF)-like protein
MSTMGAARHSPFSPVPHRRRSWLSRFGAEPPRVAADLLDRVTAPDARPDGAGIRQAAQALGVLRAHRGHAVAGLVEDLTALRALLPQTADSVRLVDAAATAAVSAYVDELTAILEARATRDPLTGLPNRATLAEALEQEVRAAHRATPPALLLIDLDGFKGVNDSDGHLAGDAVLIGVANLLAAQVRGGDLACRLGGDEFAVLLPRTSQPQAAKIARRIVAASRDDAGLASPSARVRLSVGVGWLPAPRTGDELVALADSAMYDVKAAGGDDVKVASTVDSA